MWSSGRTSRRHQRDSSSSSVDNTMGENTSMEVEDHDSVPETDGADDVKEIPEEAAESAPDGWEESREGFGVQQDRMDELVEATGTIGTFDTVDAPLGIDNDLQNLSAEDGPLKLEGAESAESVDTVPEAPENANITSQLPSLKNEASMQMDESEAPVAMGSFDEETSAKDEPPTISDDAVLDLKDQVDSGLKENKNRSDSIEGVLDEEAPGAEDPVVDRTAAENPDVALDSPALEEESERAAPVENFSAGVEHEEYEQSVVASKDEPCKDSVPEEDPPNTMSEGFHNLEADSSPEQAVMEEEDANIVKLGTMDVAGEMYAASDVEEPLLDGQDNWSGVEEDALLSLTESGDSLEAASEVGEAETSDSVSQEGVAEDLTVEEIQLKVSKQKATLESIRSKVGFVMGRQPVSCKSYDMVHDGIPHILYGDIQKFLLNLMSLFRKY